MAIYDYSPTKVELQSHIQFFSGGRCNVTLGGGRSIQLSYRGEFTRFVILTQRVLLCQLPVLAKNAKKF